MADLYGFARRSWAGRQPELLLSVAGDRAGTGVAAGRNGDAVRDGPLWLAWQVATLRPRSFFSPGFNLPLPCSAAFVFTIHGLIHLQIPAEASLAKHLYYRLIGKPACRHARGVLTVSEYSRAQILRWSGVPPVRVVNVGNGAGAPFTPDGPRRLSDGRPPAGLARQPPGTVDGAGCRAARVQAAFASRISSRASSSRWAALQIPIASPAMVGK